MTLSLIWFSSNYVFPSFFAKANERETPKSLSLRAVCVTVEIWRAIVSDVVEVVVEVTLVICLKSLMSDGER